MDDLDLAQIEIDREHKRAIKENENKLKESGVNDCISCDCVIPLARKQAVPSAVRCIDCENLEGSKYV